MADRTPRRWRAAPPGPAGARARRLRRATRRSTRSSPRAPRRRRSTTSSSRCSSSRRSCSSSSQGGVLYLAWQVPQAQGRRRQPAAPGPRQHQARARLDDPARPPARRRRRRLRAHPARPRRDRPTDAQRGRGHRPAVVVGVPLRRRRRRRGRHRHRQRPRDPRRRAGRRSPSPPATSSTRSGSPRSTARRTPCPAASHPLTIEADEPGVYRGQCTEFCGLSHAYMRMRVVALSPRPTTPTWEARAARGRGRSRRRAGRARAWSCSGRTCSQCHLISGEGGNEEAREEGGIDGAALVAGAAPNLTHFASRGIFAGGMFDLWVDQDGNGEVDPDEHRRGAQRRRPRGLAARPARRRSRWPRTRRAGMPNLNLTEEQIDALVAYLETLE